MSLFDPATPKPVTLSGTNTTTSPQYLTDYLTQLAQTGQQQLGVPNQNMVAGLPQNLQDLYSGAQSTLGQYKPAMDASFSALQDAAGGVSKEDVSKFYDPYQQDVIDEMTRQSNLNTQRNLIPALKSAFVGSGGIGGQRYANATGQALTDTQANLLGLQGKLRSEGYKSALDAALKEQGYDIQAGQGLYGLGTAEASAGTNQLKSLGDIGTQELAYNQSKLDAPLVRAQNVSKLLQGYTFPTTVSETKQQLPTAYPPSPLQQISGLGTLLASGFNNSGSGWAQSLGKWISNLGGSVNQMQLGGENPISGEYMGSLEFAKGGEVRKNWEEL